MGDAPDSRHTTHPELDALARSGRRMSLEPGHVLMAEGESGTSVFVLVEGALDVSRRVGGEDVSLARLDQPGSLVGEVVALAGGERTATVVVTERAVVIELTSDQLGTLAHRFPDLSRELVALALARVEQADFAEILARHYLIRDQDTLAHLCRGAGWRRLRPGEALFEFGEPSEFLHFVIRGSLRVERLGVDGDAETVGTIGRGDVVGELGLIQDVARTATVTAIRDSVVASIDRDAFYGLVRSHPRVMVEIGVRALTRAARPQGEAPTRILALLSPPSLNAEYMGAMVVRELRQWGSVTTLTPERVDALLGSPGASQATRRDVGDIPLTRLLHQAELENDYVLLQVGDTASPWASRCLGLADRLVVVLPGNPAEEDLDFVDRFRREMSGVDLRTTVVLAHPREAVHPSGSEAVASRVGASEVFHVREGSTGDVARVARVIGGRGHALVLGGGGGRGFAHIGVLRAMNQLGIPVDVLGGTSIGGILALVMADELDPDEIIAWADRHFGRILDYTLPLVALVKGRRILSAARTTWGDRDIQDLWRTAFVVSADLTTSRVHIHDRGPVTTAVRATSAIPGVMPPVPVDDRLLVDGGVLNNLPVDIARQLVPEGVVIASDVAPLTGPHAQLDYGLTVSGWEALFARLRGRRRSYPGISSVLLRSMIIASMQQRHVHLSSSIVDCHLDLDMRGIGMLEFDDPATGARRGFEAAMPMLEAWLEKQTAGSP